jgi:prevent-host-death family protein
MAVKIPLSEAELHLAAFIRRVRDTGERVVMEQQGELVAALISVQDYEHYLDLLDDEADSEDAELAGRLALAADSSAGGREPFRDYLKRRESAGGPLPD